MIKRISHCRVCQGRVLAPVLDLGEQVLTGVFPRSLDARVTSGPLRLVKCLADGGCGLVQLEHTYDLGEMYGENYGYRSGLNPSMERHLRFKVSQVLKRISLQPGDLVVDVGSNDGTTLGGYPDSLKLDLLGIDPTAGKFREFYRADIDLCPDFFSADLLRSIRPGKPVRVLTSFSMFYDLDDPMAFMQEAYDVLSEDGIWVLEQSYLPAMLEAVSYDTVCHEHLEYYALGQIKWMADRVGFRIINVEFNEVNGGSFSLTLAKSGNARPASGQVERVLAHEAALGLNDLSPFRRFASLVAESRAGLRSFLDSARREGRSIAALGASTKGNVILQYCAVTSSEVAEVGEINRDKFGAFTPGTNLPIVPEDEALANGHSYYLVLPWHFRSHFLANPAYAGRSLVFPLPQLEVVELARSSSR